MSVNNQISGGGLDFGVGETLLVLVRHAQTDWNVERRFQGQLDVPLSARGQVEAMEVARWLASLTVNFSTLYSSDLSRAVETARPIAALQPDINVSHAQALRELDCGEWQGLTTFQVEEKYPGQLRRWREDIKGFTLPGGEGVPDVQHRMTQYVSEAVQRHAGEAILVVSHGAALTAYLAAINGWDLQETWDSRRARMSNTGVTIVRFGTKDQPPRTLLFNSVAHLTAYEPLASVIDPEPKGERDKAATELAV
jgi:broad specificity phosphatase PhoE